MLLGNPHLQLLKGHTRDTPEDFNRTGAPIRGCALNTSQDTRTPLRPACVDGSPCRYSPEELALGGDPGYTLETTGWGAEEGKCPGAQDLKSERNSSLDRPRGLSKPPVRRTGPGHNLAWPGDLGS